MTCSTPQHCHLFVFQHNSLKDFVYRLTAHWVKYILFCLFSTSCTVSVKFLSIGRGREYVNHYHLHITYDVSCLCFASSCRGLLASTEESWFTVGAHMEVIQYCDNFCCPSQNVFALTFPFEKEGTCVLYNI